jgi:hypothetical protein
MNKLSFLNDKQRGRPLLPKEEGVIVSEEKYHSIILYDFENRNGLLQALPL